MSPLSLQDLKAPYQYVAVSDHVREAHRLLVVAEDDVMSTSVTLAALGRQGSLLILAGVGRDLWKDVDPVVYVRELRDEWGTS